MSPNNKEGSTNQGFQSSLGAIMTAVGSAVGLGNIWRFPYLMGSEGGAVFLFGYILVSLLICVPLMAMEFSIGRVGNASNVKAIKNIAPKSLWWLVGVMQVICCFAILCFYVVVGAWVVHYMQGSFTSLYDVRDTAHFSNYFGEFITGYKPIISLAIFVFLTWIIVYQGVSGGLEKYSTILIPLLAFFVLALLIYSFTLSSEGIVKSMKFLFVPNWDNVKPSIFLSILSQAFFSLSLGMGVMLLYGSYMLKTQNLISSAVKISIGDLLFSVLTGILVFNIVFSFGLEPTAGAGLLFISLPSVFDQMPGGQILSGIFFFLVLIAAVTSSISLLEVPTAFVADSLGISKKLAATFVSLTTLFIGVIVSLSLNGSIPTYSKFGLTNILLLVSIFGVCLIFAKRIVQYFEDEHEIPNQKARISSTFLISFIMVISFLILRFNADKSVFDILDTTTEKLLIPLAALSVSIIFGWVLSKQSLADALETNNRTLTYKYMIFMGKYMIPTVILLITLNGLGLISF